MGKLFRTAQLDTVHNHVCSLCIHLCAHRHGCSFISLNDGSHCGRYSKDLFLGQPLNHRTESIPWGTFMSTRCKVLGPGGFPMLRTTEEPTLLEWLQWALQHTGVTTTPPGCPTASGGAVHGRPRGSHCAGPDRHQKDTLQVVGALGGHRLCRVARGRQVNAQRLLQHPHRRHPRRSSHTRGPAHRPLGVPTVPTEPLGAPQCPTDWRGNSREIAGPFTPD